MYALSLVLLLFVSQRGLATVTLLGGQYCSTDGGDGTHADPDDIISINCAVDNPDNLVNALTWSIDSFDVSVTNTNGDNATDIDKPQFVSTVNSFDSLSRTTDATLQFPAVSDLDEAVVMCSGAQRTITSSCTLRIKTIPSDISSLICTDITYQSLVLKWNPPSDDGGESIQYSITGAPDDISIITDNTMMKIPKLTPNTEYNFVVKASNVVGPGNELPKTCTTLGNVPDGFSDVQVFLDYDFTSDNTRLYVKVSPCPIITDPITTPPIDNYIVNIIKSGNTYSTEDIDSSTCDYTIEVDEDAYDPVTYNVEVFANNIVGSSSKINVDFVASWLRDVEVTERTDTSAVIKYTTAERVLLDDLMVELNINIPSINPSRVSYVTNTTGMFSLTDLQPNILIYNLKVVSEDTTIGMTHPGSFTVPLSDSITPTAKSATGAPPIVAVIGGVVGGGVALIIIIGVLSVIVLSLWQPNIVKKPSGKDNDERTPLVKHSETGQDPSSIDHQQAPTGDIYALPEKKGSRRQPPSAPKETPTYQDPDTIQRQQAPTGDLYALPEKKPVYTQVNKENKSQGAMYAELGFQDQHPPTSPSGASLTSPLPHDTTVLYSEVRSEQQ